PTCGYILLTDNNTGRITTSGFDLSIQYLQHTGVGTFREDLEGTAVTQFLQQQYTGGPNLNLVGNYNELPPAYRWQHNVRVDWTSPQDMFGGGLSNSVLSTYTDQYGTGPTNQGPRPTVGSYSLVDAYVNYKPVKNLTVLFGIKNLLDTNPPFTNAFQGNFAAGYNALVADPLLRNFYINLKYTFFYIPPEIWFEAPPPPGPFLSLHRDDTVHRGSSCPDAPGHPQALIGTRPNQWSGSLPLSRQHGGQRLCRHRARCQASQTADR